MHRGVLNSCERSSRMVLENLSRQPLSISQRNWNVTTWNPILLTDMDQLVDCLSQCRWGEFGFCWFPHIRNYWQIKKSISILGEKYSTTVCSLQWYSDISTCRDIFNLCEYFPMWFGHLHFEIIQHIPTIYKPDFLIENIEKAFHL